MNPLITDLQRGRELASALKEKLRQSPIDFAIADELVGRVLKSFNLALEQLTEKKKPCMVEKSKGGPIRSISPANGVCDESEITQPILCPEDQILEDYVNGNPPMEWGKINTVPTGSLREFEDSRPCYVFAIPRIQIKQMNALRSLSLINNESDVDTETDGKMSSYLYGDSHRCNPQNQKETMQRGDHARNQHKRKETMKSASSYVAVLSFLFSVLSSNYSHPLHSELVPLSLWRVVWDYAIFVLFVSSVMILVTLRAQFTHLHSAMLLFWAIILHIKSAGSITTWYLPILGIFLVWWFARTKATTPPNEG